MKWKVGDRVAVYDSTGPRRIGRVEEVGPLTVEVLLENGNTRTFWPQQLRRLQKRVPERIRIRWDQTVNGGWDPVVLVDDKNAVTTSAGVEYVRVRR